MARSRVERQAFRRILPLMVLIVFGAVCGHIGRAAELEQATGLYRSGQYAECSQASTAAMAAGDTSETWPVLKIQSDLAAGRYLEARETLEQALQRFSTSVRLRWLGAEVYRFTGQGEKAQTLLDEMDQLVGRAAWRYTDPANRIVLGHFYLHRGVDAKRVLEATFNVIKKQQPDFAAAYLAAGQLALDKHDYALAAEEFQKAVQLDTTDPEIHFGLASAFAPSDDKLSTQHLRVALARNSHHVDSHLLLIDSHVDAERYDEARQLLRQVLLVNPSEPRAWAYRAVLAHVGGDAREEELSRQMALAWWQNNPEVDHLIGRKLSQKYRFREGAACQRRALAFDSRYLPAKIQLSQDLLRLGEEDEGWRLADEVAQADNYHVVAHNLVTLRDHVSKFRTLGDDGLVVLMDPREAEIYGHRVLELLRRAKSHLVAKYEVELSEPILIEIFPEQQDFAIRTFGLPGGDGFLGVCFGNVITANSPASRGDSPVSWESILWHEFCHVVTLRKTANKMPRWLSEGISVYEERQADPRWGQSMTPTYRAMILGGELTPVSDLSAAFLHAPSGGHLQFAYYESSLVVEFLIEKYGLETLKRILVDLGVGMTINDSLQRYTGSLASLDQEFAAYATKVATEFGGSADWTPPAEIPPTASLSEVTEWLKDHPNNYEGLRRQARLLIAEQQWEQAKQPLTKVLQFYPRDDVALAALVLVHRELGERDQEQQLLEKWAAASGDAVPAFLRLIEMYTEEEDWDGLKRAAENLMASNPLLPAAHRGMARAAEEKGDTAQGIAALKTALLMSPLDEVDLHFRLACLLQKQGDLVAAKRHVLQSLEEAPRFRTGHQKLLELVRQIQENEKRAEP